MLVNNNPSTQTSAALPRPGLQAPLELDFAPYRLSGVVVGTLLNHRPALQALGEAAHAAPYKAAPSAPVLYVKPRNTLAAHGAVISVPHDVPALQVGASLGIVMGRTACRVPEGQALQHVAGYTIVHDICIPHSVYYRPSIRLIARDGFCPIGPQVVARDAIAQPDALRVQVWVNDVLQHATDTADRIRPVARLIQDVSAFMTLQPGDVLMLGPSWAPPSARSGDTVRTVIDGVGELVNHFAAEGATA